MDEPRKPRLLTRPDVLAWAMYDWANSAYSTLSITIVVVFFSEILFPESIPVLDAAGNAVLDAAGKPLLKEFWGTWSGAAYAYALAVATLGAGLLSPVVGALADARGNKHVWLSWTALLGASCCLGMAWAPADPPWLATGLFMAALFFFELSYGFANAFLPDIATEEQMNRVSAFGFGLGYIGGALALIVAITLITLSNDWGWTGEQKLRCGLAVMGCWWGVFSLPAVFLLRDRSGRARRNDVAVAAGAPAALAERQTLAGAFRIALTDVRRTLGDMRNYRMLALFLVGFLLYNDCVQTVISQASNFAGKDLEFDVGQLTKVILMIQFVALPGSLFIGWLSDRIGQYRVMFLCLFAWAAILLSSWFIPGKTEPNYDREHSQLLFWIMGAGVALVMGGIQSVSRAIMGTMTPPEKSAEFFGFFNLSSKATCFIGPMIFGAVYTATGNYKLAILSLLFQLILGGLIVSRVNIEQGRRDARGGTPA